MLFNLIPKKSCFYQFYRFTRNSSRGTAKFCITKFCHFQLWISFFPVARSVDAGASCRLHGSRSSEACRSNLESAVVGWSFAGKICSVACVRRIGCRIRCCIRCCIPSWAIASTRRSWSAYLVPTHGFVTCSISNSIFALLDLMNISGALRSGSTGNRTNRISEMNLKIGKRRTFFWKAACCSSVLICSAADNSHQIV